MWIRILFAAVLLVLDLGGPWSPNVSLVYAQKPEVAEIDAWLGRYRDLWEQRLDALHTEIARGKRDRRSTT